MEQHTNSTQTTSDGRPVLQVQSPQRPRTLGDVFIARQFPLGDLGAGWLGALVTAGENVQCWRPEHPTTAATAGIALVVIGAGDRVHALAVDTICATTSPVSVVERGDWTGQGWLAVDPVGLVAALAIADLR